MGDSTASICPFIVIVVKCGKWAVVLPGKGIACIARITADTQGVVNLKNIPTMFLAADIQIEFHQVQTHTSNSSNQHGMNYLHPKVTTVVPVMMVKTLITLYLDRPSN